MRRLINQRPGRALATTLTLLPFLALLIFYQFASSARLAENEQDRLLPAFSTMGEALYRMAFTEDRRTGEYLFWVDTVASMERLAAGVGTGAVLGLAFGVLAGLFPLARATLSPFMAAVAMVPPLAMLPVLFIALGMDELSKVVLIAIGVGPFIARDLEGRIREMPAEELIKAQTLGAGSWRTLWRVVLPQILPRLVDAVRLSLGAAWLFLIAAEAIASTEGLGYRIFLVRRYLAMDVILPYVVWITLLAWLTDYLLRRLNALLFPWQALPADEAAA
ncbi:MAG: ABC transporter permease [Pseudomonadales bacterium]|jgi:NitT/TauT family transport system permease protein|nr:ABC transporter permease [Pseudomonadales bacterium]